MSGRSSLGVAVGLLVSFALGWALGGGQPSPAGVTPFPAVSDEAPSEELQRILAIGSPRLRARALLDFLDRADPSSASSLQEQLSAVNGVLSTRVLTGTPGTLYNVAKLGRDMWGLTN